MRILILAGLATATLLFGCGELPPQQTAATTDNDREAPAPAALAVSLEALLLNDPTVDGFPAHEVRLLVNGEVYVIDTVAVCPDLKPAERLQNKIPADALAACGGWFAGGGDYFYVWRRNDSLLLYQGWLDEMQQDESYHYEVVWSTAL
jgi:hypothetical protein